MGEEQFSINFVRLSLAGPSKYPINLLLCFVILTSFAHSNKVGYSVLYDGRTNS